MPRRSCVFRAKSGQNVWFSEPLPQKEQPLMGVGATFWTTFLYTTGPDVPSAGRGSKPGGRLDLRAAEVINFPPKNKVKRLSPSTSHMVWQVWLHLRTTLGLALPSPWHAGRYPLNFDFCVGLIIAKTPEPLIASQKHDRFWKGLHLGYLNLKWH